MVSDLIPSLKLAVKQNLKRLEEGGTRKNEGAQIGHLRRIVAKVKSVKSKETELKGPDAKKRKGGIEMYFEQLAIKTQNT